MRLAHAPTIVTVDEDIVVTEGNVDLVVAEEEADMVAAEEAEGVTDENERKL